MNKGDTAFGAVGSLLSDSEELIAIDRSRRAVYQLLSRFWAGEIDEFAWDALQNYPFDEEIGLESFDEAMRRLGAFVREHGAEGDVGHGGFAPDDPSYNSPAFSQDERPQILRTLAADYAMLCRGANRDRGADPYESVHRSATGLLMQDEWESVFLLYRRAGLRLAEGSVEPEDHLGFELECMEKLIGRGADALDAADEAGYASAFAFQREMLDGHLRCWVPRFVKLVNQYAETEFYRAIADMTEAYLEADSSYLAELSASMPA